MLSDIGPDPRQDGTAPPASPSRPPLPPPAPLPPTVPSGFRQGIITAITVLLGFSLAFWRFWGFESPGYWSRGSLAAAACLILAVALQILALFRALRVEDDSIPEYRRTVRWFIASALALLAGLTIAMMDAALIEQVD
ncbi:hypothetical protein D9X30_1283 [Cupriavidus sp. U2]|uniref:hypothetical protein n=1 Tax=Cupriavidus sp. U2 TaxID=2920269 RepID=UPI001E555753|nr:hypothetical protein [Cupriavidus sp. U2]KAI3593556.1 hypothetical protein D9X30_1283 [Cupriavidus sp. U2]